MSTPYELLAGLALLREEKAQLTFEHEQDLKNGRASRYILGNKSA